jgi:N-acetylglucosamine malate deacetylase 1
MTPYRQLVADYSRLLKQGRSFPLGDFKPAPSPELPPDAPKALLFSPHPDDECIVGGMAVRLLRQARMNVVNVAVTLGSNKQRQPGRLQELQNACHYLGFNLVTTAPNGLERINPKAREQDPAHWSACVEIISGIIAQHRPQVILCPHDRDWNSTHIGTHYLILDALKKTPPSFQTYLVETEFWGAMTNPNLMVEISVEDLADMIAATSFHIGEVARNPYHLLLPPWMMDNVRRGAELVGGQGGAAPDFPFAALYRLRKWAGGQATGFFDGGKMMPCSMNVAELFG